MSEEQPPVPSRPAPASEVAWSAQLGRPLHPMLDFDIERRIAVVCLPLALRNGEATGQCGRSAQAKPYLIVVGDGFKNCVPLELAAISLETEPVFIEQRSRWPEAELKAFLDGSAAAPSGADVFDSIVDLLAKYIDLPEPAEVKTVALFVMMSYLHPLFPTLPYLKLEGQRASGKTRLATIIAMLAHNSLHTSSLTPASIFRVSQGTRCTLIADEMEGLAKNKQLSMLLNAGYKRGAVVVRAGTKGRLELFQSFGPKVIASIEPLNEVLASRTLLVRLTPTGDVAKARRAVTESGEDWGELRSMLYAWALTSWSGVMGATIPEVAGISNRVAEIWLPLLQVASSLETQRPGLLQELTTYAARSVAPALPALAYSAHERLVIGALVRLAQAGRPQELTPAAILAAVTSQNPGAGLPTTNGLGVILRRLRLFSSRRHAADGQRYVVDWPRVIELGSGLG